MMTREHKLALIIGFALVLVVGLLISDNFSASRKSEPGGPSTAEAQQPILREDVLVGDGHTDRPTITGAPVDGVLQNSGFTTGQGGIAAVNDAVDAGPTTLTFGDRVRGAWDDTLTELGNGHVSTPEAAGIDRVARGGTGPQANPAITPGVAPAGEASLFAPEQAPFRENGLGGAGSDLGGLGVRPADLVKPADAAPTSAQAKPTERRHQIVEGDSFWKISAKYYNDGKLAEALKSYNKDRTGKNGQLRVGASLLIPEKAVLTGGMSGGLSGGKTAKPPENRVPAFDKKSDLKVPSKDTVAKAAESAKKPAPPATYTVKKGDTLEKIAVKFLGSASRVDDLMRANRDKLDSEDDVRAGDVLKIPAR